MSIVTNRIYTNKLGYGEPTNGDATSDTIKELQSLLNVQVTGKYDARTDEAVRTWQASIGDVPDPAGRSYLGPKQAAAMFPADTYTVYSVGLPVIATAPELLAPYAVWNPIEGSPGLRPFTGDARKITLHTTETTAKPDWAAKGSGLPHFTFDPPTGTIWQHLPLDIAAYTLAGGANSPNSAAGVNIQVEMIGYAAKVPDWSATAYTNLKHLLDWITDVVDVPREFPFPFTGSDGYGTDGSVRQTWPTFADASGIVGHAHAPYNTHWDPGLLNTDALYAAQPPEPLPEYVPRAEFDVLVAETAVLRAELADLRATLADGFQTMSDTVQGS